MSFKKETKILEEHLLNDLKWNSLQRGDHIDDGSFSHVYVYTHNEKPKPEKSSNPKKKTKNKIMQESRVFKISQPILNLDNSQWFSMDM